MSGLRDVKRRIKSVNNTRKITRAMQLVSAAKMKRAQEMAISSRTYAEVAWELIQNIAHLGAFEHPLIRTYQRASKTGVLLITSNRGLVGSLNTNLIGKLKDLFVSNGTNIEFITLGKKGGQALSRLQKTVVADFAKADKTPATEEILPMARMIVQMYESGEYRRIYLAYNHFISTLSQKATIKQILPLLESIRTQLISEEDRAEIGETEYIFEPEPAEVLNHLLPRIIESQIYETILEADASEHSARMVMMKNATEAAEDLIVDLTLTFNQLRQGKITTELAEITAGKIALE